MKTYVLTVSDFFPKTHKKSGVSTGFVKNISKLFTIENTKIHTIRSNYDLWLKRANEINIGNAVLSIRYWSGKPYNSKQIEIATLERIGVEKLEFYEDKDGIPSLKYPLINNSKEPKIEVIAKNDGLELSDFKDWFKSYDLSKPMAIIHFTDFRYNSTTKK